MGRSEAVEDINSLERPVLNFLASRAAGWWGGGGLRLRISPLGGHHQLNDGLSITKKKHRYMCHIQYIQVQAVLPRPVLGCGERKRP